ncbi:unnamed protein product [Effrenium voratum]|nr:unnamed protein product [Effrenium voratum]
MPEGSPSQVMHAEVLGQPASLVKVAIPSGATAGQQINFTMPNGQRVTTSVQETVQPGAVLTVSVPAPEVVAAPAVSAVPAAPVASDSLAQAREVLLPQPVVNADEADRQQAMMTWAAFGASFLVCLVCGLPCACCIWGAVALNYFCKPMEERRRSPRSFGPACASVVTAGVCMVIGALVAAVAAVAWCSDPNASDGCHDLMKWVNHTHGHHGWHHVHGEKKMFLHDVLEKMKHKHEEEGPKLLPGVEAAVSMSGPEAEWKAPVIF